MTTEYTSWTEVKIKARQADRRTDAGRQAGVVAAAEHREAYIRSHQLDAGHEAAGLISEPE